MKLSPRQSEALAFIRAFLADHGYPPTVRELASHLRVNVKTSHEFFRALERKGALVRAPGIPRGIRLANGSWDDKAEE